MAEEEHKNIAVVILGIVAVIAVVGLVLLFTGAQSATGQGIYGGAMKMVSYPLWTGRGVPQNVPGKDFTPGRTGDVDLQTHWNFYDNSNNRNPYGDVPSALRKCGRGGFMISSSQGLPEYYAQQGFDVVRTGNDKGGFACVYPQDTMVGGIA